MQVENIQQFFEGCLNSLLSAERQLTEALPKMANAAVTPALKESFEAHLEQTREHISRLEKIAKKYNFDIGEVKPNLGMQGLIAEGEEKMAMQIADSLMLDAALIGAAQKVEHYEIAAYDELIALTSLIGDEDDVALLEATLEEENETSELLMTIADEEVLQAVADSFEIEEDSEAEEDMEGLESEDQDEEEESEDSEEENSDDSEESNSDEELDSEDSENSEEESTTSR